MKKTILMIFAIVAIALSMQVNAQSKGKSDNELKRDAIVRYIYKHYGKNCAESKRNPMSMIENCTYFDMNGKYFAIVEWRNPCNEEAVGYMTSILDITYLEELHWVDFTYGNRNASYKRRWQIRPRSPGAKYDIKYNALTETTREGYKCNWVYEIDEFVQYSDEDLLYYIIKMDKGRAEEERYRYKSKKSTLLSPMRRDMPGRHVSRLAKEERHINSIIKINNCRIKILDYGDILLTGFQNIKFNIHDIDNIYYLFETGRRDMVRIICKEGDNCMISGGRYYMNGLSIEVETKAEAEYVIKSLLGIKSMVPKN